MESYFFKRSAVDFEIASSWADLQPDGYEYRHIEERSDQKSPKSHSNHQQPSQSEPAQTQAKRDAAILTMNTGLAKLEVRPADGTEADDDQQIRTDVRTDKELMCEVVL